METTLIQPFRRSSIINHIFYINITHFTSLECLLCLSHHFLYRVIQEEASPRALISPLRAVLVLGPIVPCIIWVRVLDKIQLQDQIYIHLMVKTQCKLITKLRLLQQFMMYKIYRLTRISFVAKYGRFSRNSTMGYSYQETYTFLN